MVGPVPEGCKEDVKPFAIPENAFETLTNAYQSRGRVVRGNGYTLLGRLANNILVMGLKYRQLYERMTMFRFDLRQLVAFDTTQAYFYDTGSSSFSSLPSFMPVTWNGSDYQFFFTTNYAGGFWATNGVAGFNGWAIQSFSNQTGTGLSATVNVTSTGNTAAVGDYVYFFNIQGTPTANNLVFGQVTAINVGSNPAVITVQALNVTSGFTFTNGNPSVGYLMDSMQAVSGQDGIRYYGPLNYGGSTTHNSWGELQSPFKCYNSSLWSFAYFPI